MADSNNIFNANALFETANYEAAIASYARIAAASDDPLHRGAAFNLFLAQNRFRRTSLSRPKRVAICISAGVMPVSADHLEELQGRYTQSGAVVSVIDAQQLDAANTAALCAPGSGLATLESGDLSAACYRFLTDRPFDIVLLVGPSPEALAFGAMARLIWQASVSVEMEGHGTAIDHEVMEIWKAIYSHAFGHRLGRYPLGPLEDTALAKVFEIAGGWEGLTRRIVIQTPETATINKVASSSVKGPADLTVIVYTVLVGDYEALKEPENPDPRVRYLLFTDNPEVKTEHWEVVPLDTLGLSPRRASRLPKLLPHRYLPEHDISLYIDASITLIEPDILSVAHRALQGVDIAAYPHFRRNCIYAEIDECLEQHKADPERSKALRDRLKKEQFPRDWGLLENAFLIRRNSLVMRRINDIWFKEYISGPERDQFSLMYVLWRAEIPYGVIGQEGNFRNSSHLRWTKHVGATACNSHPAADNIAKDFAFLDEYDEKYILDQALTIINSDNNLCDNRTQLKISKNLLSSLSELIIKLDYLGSYLTSAHKVRFELSKKITADANNQFKDMVIAYIASSKAPTIEANNVHIMKMCDAFSRIGVRTKLYAIEAAPKERIKHKNWREYFGLSHFDNFVPVPQRPGDALATYTDIVRRAINDGATHIYTRRLEVAAISTLLDVPTILELHKDIPDWQQPILELVMRSPALEKLVVISSPLKREFERLHVAASERIKIVPDGADIPSDTRSQFEMAERPSSRGHVGYVGHLYPGKGAEILLEVSQKMPDVQFHVLGGTEKDIKHWSSRSKNQHNLIFYGHRPPSEVPAFLDLMDIAIAPFLEKIKASGAETDIGKYISPLKIFEYMAARKPIVCSRIPVLEDILEDGRNAILCDPNDPDKFVDALDILLSDRSLADRIASEAFSDLEERYTWEKRARTLVGLYTRRWSGRIDTLSRMACGGSELGKAQPKPLVHWAYGGEKQSGWAYGVNAQRISSRIKSCDHHVPRLAEHKTGKKPEVVLAFDILISSKDEFRKKFKNTKRILRVGGPNPLKIISGGNINILTDLLAENDAIIALSPQLKDYISQLHPSAHFIPNGIDIIKYNPSCIKGRDKKPFTVGMSASISNEFQKNTKGYYYAVEACSAAEAELLVVGRGVNQIPHERLVGEFYSRIDALIHPVGAGKEASSNVIMEALALGIPVITTRHAGFHGTALEHGRDGLIVRRTVAELTEAVLAIKHDESLRQSLSEAGPEFVARHHALDVVAKQYESVIWKLLL
ncbi:glycosyltransferase [Glycocaulis sp.]